MFSKGLWLGVVLACLGYPDHTGAGNPGRDRDEIYSAAIQHLIPTLPQDQGDPPPTLLINQSAEMSTFCLIERVLCRGEEPWDVALGTLRRLVPKAPKDPLAVGEALKFFAWAYAKGGKMAEDIGYVPLPKNLAAEIEKVWASTIKDASGKPLYALMP